MRQWAAKRERPGERTREKGGGGKKRKRRTCSKSGNRAAIHGIAGWSVSSTLTTLKTLFYIQ